MICIRQKEDCCGCHACITACPCRCITMESDSEGFLYPRVNKDSCIDCGLCEKVCPMLMSIPSGSSPSVFAAWNRDAFIRAQSSSGGVFTALMRQTLRQEGVIIGSAFDKDMILRHQFAHNEEESHKFRGSKYLQSIIGDVFREVKQYLEQSRRVLFSGTPCQIAGLYGYLGKDYINLLTCDMICHGVPSPKVFSAYRRLVERQNSAKVIKANFRRKDFGWKLFSIALTFDSGNEYCKDLKNDPFMQGFLSDLYLRPSCHSCRFARLPRVADITLGDFWGVGDHHPEWDDDKGTSLILTQTDKGQIAFKSCCDDLVTYDADLEAAIKYNPCICGSVSPNTKRLAFFKDLDAVPFDKVIKKYMMPSSLRFRIYRIKNSFIRIVKRFLI